jgi:uncharacterized protein (DUF2384 family)
MAVLDLSAQICELEKALGISRDTLALALSVNPRTVDRWCAEDGTFPQKEQRRRLDELDELRTHLYQTFSSAETAQLWMHTDSPYLGGMKPADALRAGRIDRVEAALVALDYGAFV